MLKVEGLGGRKEECGITGSISLNQKSSAATCSVYWGPTWDTGTSSLLAASRATLVALVTHLAKPSWAETECSVRPIWLGQVTNSVWDESVG